MWQFLVYTSGNWAALLPLSATGNECLTPVKWGLIQPCFFFWTLQDYLLLINSLHQKFCLQTSCTIWKFWFFLYLLFSTAQFFSSFAIAVTFIFTPAFVLSWTSWTPLTKPLILSPSCGCTACFQLKQKPSKCFFGGKAFFFHSARKHLPCRIAADYY